MLSYNEKFKGIDYFIIFLSKYTVIQLVIESIDISYRIFKLNESQLT